MLPTALASPPAALGLTEAITTIHRASHGSYGIRRVHAEPRPGHGISVSYGIVMLLMQRAGLKGPPGNRRRQPRHDAPTAVGLVDRKFATTAQDKLWVTDITEHPTREGEVYCAVVLDTFSRRVVGGSIDSTQTAALVTNALNMYKFPELLHVHEEDPARRHCDRRPRSDSPHRQFGLRGLPLADRFAEGGVAGPIVLPRVSSAQQRTVR